MARPAEVTGGNRWIEGRRGGGHTDCMPTPIFPTIDAAESDVLEVAIALAMKYQEPALLAAALALYDRRLQLRYCTRLGATHH